ncbi:hypothetical protein [Alicyclobacillus shizuokensis]|uniref:hypothetical protein n=1 Tax=Alicyclobacillus shizuokensis TaxID=392014 RepID=UPI00083697B2|nr:hypothetical protein [Alicyclobacillus shizuokensis]
MNREELAQYFVYELVQPSGNAERRVSTAILALERLEELGWTLEEIKQELDTFAKSYPQIIRNVYHLEEIFGQKEPPGNLMEPDVFYYHNELREVPPPTRIVKDPVTGQFIRTDSEFYLEMKRRFTMNDLLAYWYRSNGTVDPKEHTRRQDEARFRYLLGIYNLDEILFAIDCAKSLREERQQSPLRNVFELERYIEDARQMLLEKINVHKLAGINQIIPKKVQA